MVEKVRIVRRIPKKPGGVQLYFMSDGRYMLENGIFLLDDRDENLHYSNWHTHDCGYLKGQQVRLKSELGLEEGTVTYVSNTQEKIRLPSVLENIGDTRISTCIAVSYTSFVPDEDAEFRKLKIDIHETYGHHPIDYWFNPFTKLQIDTRRLKNKPFSPAVLLT